MLKAFVIRDDKGKFKDLEDVVRIARALGKQYFKVKENIVKVLRIWGPDPLYGYVILVEGPERTNPSDVEAKSSSWK